MNHIIRIHFGRIFAMLSPLTLQHMTEIAQANQVTTPWESQWRNLIHPSQVNTYLPELYSRDFLEMVDSSTANDSPLYCILLPYCPRDVVREISRSLWYREHDTLRWRDAEFQANINLFLKEDCGEISYQHVNIFENEVSLHPCTHAPFSASKCMEYEETSTRLNDLHSFQISGEYLQKYPVILVGAQVYTHKSLTGKFPVLNLSDTTRNIQYATGISGGIPVVFNTRENGNHTKTFKDYFQTLKAVAGLLSPKNSTLILCKFFLLEGTNPDSKVEIFLQAMAFLRVGHPFFSKERNDLYVLFRSL